MNPHVRLPYTSPFCPLTHAANERHMHVRCKIRIKAHDYVSITDDLCLTNASQWHGTSPNDHYIKHVPMEVWRYVGPINYHFETNSCYKIPHLHTSSAIARDVMRQVR